MEYEQGFESVGHDTEGPWACYPKLSRVVVTS